MKLRSVLKICSLIFILLLPLSLSAKTKQTKSQVILKREIDFFLKKSNTPRTIKAIEVYSRRDKNAIFDSNSQLLLNPASNLKIVTTSFALQNLGSSYKFKTRFVSFGVRREDAIDGDLVVVAGGDPLITHDDLDSIAKIIGDEGIKNISGNLVVDVSKFDSLHWDSGWMWDDEPGQYQMFISPACLDHNTIEVCVSLDSSGQNLVVTTRPVTEFIRIVSAAVKSALDSLFVTRVMKDDTNTILVRGTYTQNLRPREYTFSLRHPAKYFGTVFKEMLNKRGILVQGNVEVVSGYSRRSIALDTLLVLEHSIDTVITYVNKLSDNLGAECFLREVPSEIGRQTGSAENGITMEEMFLEEIGADSAEYHIVDGCGLSRYDLITPDAIVKVLNHDLGQPAAQLFLHSLPISGTDGTLERRMTRDFTTGNVVAKTGSINGVSTLSGFILLPKDTLVFSMMMQNFIESGDTMRALQDSICTVLALYNDNSSVFTKSLKKHHVGTNWEMYQRREFHQHQRSRLDRMKRVPSESRKKPQAGR